MLDFLFGWRKASKCKKLIKRTQYRLMLLKSKRFSVIRLLKEDIAQLLKNQHEQIAMNKLQELYIDENIMSMYDKLITFSEFILLNMSYIRRHKEIPNDVNEGISTLLFASARIGELPELRLIRKLFMERYGKRFVTEAIELFPGNRVNSLVKDKLSLQSVPEDVKNRMVDEIVRDYFFKPRQLAIEYKPAIKEQLQKVTECTKVHRQDTKEKEISTSANCSIVLQPSPSIPNSPRHSTLTIFAPLSPPYYHKIGRHSYENSIYLDDIEEFKLQSKQRANCEDQDQRFFMFKMETQTLNHDQEDHQSVLNYHEKQSRKRMRRKKLLSKENQTINDPQCEIYYSSSPGNQRKHKKKIHNSEIKRINFLCQSNKMLQAIEGSCKQKCSLDQPCYFYVNTDNNQGYEMLLLRQISKDIRRTSSLPVVNGFGEFSGGIRNSNSPRHVHPKLPDYDQIAAKFRALKKAHLQTKGTP